uniref:Chromo domain-containing protein n=1 Tax=Globodera rostochiensis TaxID=31243 RepID=A0A914I9U0_GLORO
MAQNAPKRVNFWGEYEVERVLDRREHLGETHYFVKWRNYTSKNNSWVPASACNCQDLITQYETEYGLWGRARSASSKHPIAKQPAKEKAQSNFWAKEEAASSSNGFELNHQRDPSAKTASTKQAVDKHSSAAQQCNSPSNTLGKEAPIIDLTSDVNSNEDKSNSSDVEVIEKSQPITTNRKQATSPSKSIRRSTPLFNQLGTLLGTTRSYDSGTINNRNDGRLDNNHRTSMEHGSNSDMASTNRKAMVKARTRSTPQPTTKRVGSNRRSQSPQPSKLPQRIYTWTTTASKGTTPKHPGNIAARQTAQRHQQSPACSPIYEDGQTCPIKKNGRMNPIYG